MNEEIEMKNTIISEEIEMDFGILLQLKSTKSTILVLMDTIVKKNF